MRFMIAAFVFVVLAVPVERAYANTLGGGYHCGNNLSLQYTRYWRAPRFDGWEYVFFNYTRANIYVQIDLQSGSFSNAIVQSGGSRSLFVRQTDPARNITCALWQ